MLSKKNRLAKTKDINLVYSRGRAFFSPYFTVKILKTPDTKTVQATVVVSTKVSKKAVVRNRIKRQLRESIRLHVGELLVGKYVVGVKARTAGLDPRDVQAYFVHFLTQTKLLKQKSNV